MGDGARQLVRSRHRVPDKHPEVDKVLETYLEYYLEHPTEHTKWMPHARAVLDELRGYKLAICHQQASQDHRRGPRATRREKPFPAVIAQGRICRSRSPRRFRSSKLPSKLALEPRQLVMVGDGPQDIEAGRRAGCRTIGVQGGFLAPERLIAVAARRIHRFAGRAAGTSCRAGATRRSHGRYFATGRTTTSRMPLRNVW